MLYGGDMDLISVGSTGIRSKLLTITAITGIVDNGLYLHNAPSIDVAPYIIMRHVWGGNTNQTPRDTFDMLWTVVAVSSDQTQSLELAGYIYGALYRQFLEYPVGWRDYAGVTSNAPYHDLSIVENNLYYASGNYYRLRGEKALT